MKKKNNKPTHLKNNDMRDNYDYKDGVRGKHYRAMQDGYTITIHNEDGSTVIKEVTPKKRVSFHRTGCKRIFPGF